MIHTRSALLRTAPRSSSRTALVARAATASITRSFSAPAASIVFQSPHPPLHVPNQTVWDAISERSGSIGHRDALVCGLSHENMTYQQLCDNVRRVADGLRADGLKKGDIVLVHSFNCVEYPIIYLAMNALGVVSSPASPMMLPHDLAAQAQAANAKAIITHRALEGVALEAAALAGLSSDRVYSAGKSPAETKTKSINELMESNVDTSKIQFDRVDPEAMTLLPFSSGTTGKPKGVSLSNRNLLANSLQVCHVEDLRPHSLGLLPFYHVYGMMVMHVTLLQGATNVVLPKFEPESFLNTLTKYKIKKAHVAPPIALFLAHHPLVDKYDLSATEHLVSGGAPMGKEVEALVQKRLNVSVKQAYGLTEASPALNYTEDNFTKEGTQGTVGRLVPGTELRVRCTQNDVDLPANETGELMYRGPQIMKGYFNNDDANKETLTEDGFLRTGDVGYIDDHGFVYVVDRVKELIKYKAYQVPPAELEDVLNHHPAISDACCVRGMDPKTGEEVPKAYVVRKDPALTEEEVMDFVASKVTPYKKVRQVEFIDEIPKSATGKILRRVLQDQEIASRSR
ncbi:TPA: hypothetical protein N0F65_004806 [Lagenidium giganteum]|uniref:4-coumarate--CoA ligase n=1 Tax=Lagenidium giganteum TaxID=4803 RepID=A0AAV2Z483_9STRA|nr:TPA: hypothetical protein N0F65_004806 [Lagenidium giganteum]